MDRKKGNKDKKVSFNNNTVQVERVSKNSIEEEIPDKKRGRNKEEDSDDEEQKQMRITAENSRKKKRKLLANVEDDSADSGEGYEGEELDGQIAEDEWNSGIQLESFNLKDELRDGVIDITTGAVSTKKAKEEEEDEDWLKDYDSNMKDDAYVTKLEKLRGKWKKQEEEYEREGDSFTHFEILQLLDEASDALQWGESVSKALNRLRPKTNNNNNNNKKKSSTTTSKNSNEAKEETPFDKFTIAVDKLVNAEGLVDIYSMTKEELLDHIETAKGKYVTWEYKWPNAPEIYGPYTNDQMKGWAEEGYFIFEEGKHILVNKIVQGKLAEFVPLLENIF